MPSAPAASEIAPGFFFGVIAIARIIMRATANELTPRLGQSFVIENKGGASGIPGAQACAQATPDGYTLCLVYHNTLSILRAIRSSTCRSSISAPIRR